MNKDKHTILVLDDDPDIGTMIRIMLEYKGYKVVVINRANDMDAALKKQSVSLIIMDMLLSGHNGSDVCSTLKQFPETSEIPIMMFSAHPNAREICMNAGADAFIAKPFDIQDLYKRVDSLINEVL